MWDVPVVQYNIPIFVLNSACIHSWCNLTHLVPAHNTAIYCYKSWLACYVQMEYTFFAHDSEYWQFSLWITRYCNIRNVSWLTTRHILKPCMPSINCSHMYSTSEMSANCWHFTTNLHNYIMVALWLYKPFEISLWLCHNLSTQWLLCYNTFVTFWKLNAVWLHIELCVTVYMTVFVHVCMRVCIPRNWAINRLKILVFGIIKRPLRRVSVQLSLSLYVDTSAPPSVYFFLCASNAVANLILLGVESYSQEPRIVWCCDSRPYIPSHLLGLASLQKASHCTKGPESCKFGEMRLVFLQSNEPPVLLPPASSSPSSGNHIANSGSGNSICTRTSDCTIYVIAFIYTLQSMLGHC